MSYLFGAGTDIPTPAELKRRRTVAEALAERAGDTSPTTLAGGLGRVAQGLMARYARNKADKDEKAGMASASDGFSKVMQKLMGGGTAASSMQGSTAAQTSAPALTGDLAQTEAYIRKAAAARGIDPDIAVKVARSEGLAPGVYQSNIVKNGQREPSYGPFQLYTGGGLGNEFMKKTGLDPRDPSTVNQQIDFALDAAKSGGWSPWYGAKKVGVGNWDGIGGQMQPAGGQAPAQEPPPRTPINIVDDQGILAQQQSVAPSQEMPPQQQGATAVPQGYEQAVSEVSALPIEEVVQLLSNPYLNDAQRSVVQFAFEKMMNPPDPMEAQMKQLQLQKMQAEIEKMNNPQANSEAGLNLVYWKGADGKLRAGQPLKGGGIKEVPLPEGGEWAPGVGYLDTGTGFVPYDKRGGVSGEQPIPKDLAGAEAQKEIGTAVGKATAAASSDMAAAETALTLLDSIEKDPNLDRGVGFTSIGNIIPGTAGRDFQTKVDQATSGAFLSAIQQMRGMGALSNAEGQTATQAITRMTTSASKEEFLSALNDYRQIVQAGYDRAAARMGGAAPAPQQGGAEEWTIGPNGQPVRVR